MNLSGFFFLILKNLIQNENAELMNDVASAVFQLATNGSIGIDLARRLFWTRAFCFNSFQQLSQGFVWRREGVGWHQEGREGRREG